MMNYLNEETNKYGRSRMSIISYIYLVIISLVFVALIVIIYFKECSKSSEILGKPFSTNFELISYQVDDQISYSEYLIYDKETKVEYILLQNNRYTSDAVLLPIFNSDGTLKTHEVN